MNVSRREFEALVNEALEELPERFRALLENIAIVVEEEPTDDDYDETDIPDEDELLGIFRGTPLTVRSYDAPPSLPDQVAIFRGPILRICDSREEVIEEVRDTVIHELGHYFGLEDDEMPY